MLSRRLFLAAMGGLLGALGWKPTVRPAGWNPNDTPGDQIGDGWSGRITDPVTGAGLFNSNTDPNIVGIDPLTGSDAPAGTDVGFGAALRRFLTAGVFNGDFAVPPPDATAPIVSDEADAGYNALPYWRAVGPTNGSGVGALVASAAPSGRSLQVTLTAAGASDEWYIEQLVPVNGSTDRSYAYLLNSYCTVTGGVTQFIRGQYLKSDTTTTGSSVEASVASTGRLFLNMEQIPADAYYLRFQVGARNGTGTATFSETRSTTGLETLVLNDRTAGNDPGVLYKAGGSVVLGVNMTADAIGTLVRLNLDDGVISGQVGATFVGLFYLSDAFALQGIYTPATITAAQDNYAPTNLSVANVLRLSSDASRNITGIVAQENGRILYIVNVGSFNINLMHQDAGSSAANRIIAPDATSIVVAGGGGTTLWYDGTSSRWRSLSQRA